MSGFRLEDVVRNNIKDLAPYVSARHTFIGEAKALLDANESPYGDGIVNRYPDPLVSSLREEIAKRENVKPEQVVCGNGSDEILDLIVRIFCEPGKDSILICPPTFGMYKVSAAINDVEVKAVPLINNFQLNIEGIVAEKAKVLFLCSPNSPTGNLMDVSDIEQILQEWPGVVVIDEAYIEFTESESWVSTLAMFPNLIVTRTFSKFWGLAGCRIGYGIASAEIVSFLAAVKPPYNVDNLAYNAALEALSQEDEKKRQAAIQLEQRDILKNVLVSLSFVEKVHPSDSNFLFTSLREDATTLYEHCKANGIIIRRYGKDPMSIRISAGTPEETEHLIAVLRSYTSK